MEKYSSISLSKKSKEAMEEYKYDDESWTKFFERVYARLEKEQG